MIVATGARNPLRDVGTEYKAADTMSALGYYVPAEQERIDIQFLENLEGYIWVFPRSGHLSVGICGKGEPAIALRARLDAYMDERGIPRKEAKFYSHMLPSLESAGWKKNRVSGRDWLAVGGRRRPRRSHHRRRSLLRNPLRRPRQPSRPQRCALALRQSRRLSRRHRT
ncbi:MAG: hypothetical protein WDO18_05075 [Acidobacteriota bacterium]